MKKEAQLPPTERIEKIVAEIKKRTKKDAYKLIINPQLTPTVFDSKFGGLPYWDMSKPYPTSPDGKKMILLAQINFDKSDVKEPLPQSGMLQFFIAPDDVYGMNFDMPDAQDTFRVVYHKDIDTTVTAEQIRALGVSDASSDTDEYEYTPICQEVAVDIQDTISYMSASSYEFEDIVKSIAQDLYGDYKCKTYYDFLTKEENDYLFEEIDTIGHNMLGYPFFTQDDPRYNEEYRKYDTVLLQIDSEMADKGKDYVLWGDCGVCNFFISQEDLKNGDFSKVLYNWDCC